MIKSKAYSYFAIGAYVTSESYLDYFLLECLHPTIKNTMAMIAHRAATKLIPDGLNHRPTPNIDRRVGPDRSVWANRKMMSEIKSQKLPAMKYLMFDAFM
jgi:hypothetical protein